MKAARKLFGERGFAATSVDDIAAASRVAKGAIYHYFKTKIDLFEAKVGCLPESAAGKDGILGIVDADDFRGACGQALCSEALAAAGVEDRLAGDHLLGDFVGGYVPGVVVVETLSPAWPLAGECVRTLRGAGFLRGFL